jgi:hypothetical protein
MLAGETEQSVVVPWDNITVAAASAGRVVTVTQAGGAGTFNGGNGGTLTLDGNGGETNIRVDVSKTVGGGSYAKEYRVNIAKGAVDFPTEFLAEGGSVSIVKEGGSYYEAHKFGYNGGVANGLVFSDSPSGTVMAWVLVVAGGGNGSAGQEGNGGGSGGVAEHTTRLRRAAIRLLLVRAARRLRPDKHMPTPAITARTPVSAMCSWLTVAVATTVIIMAPATAGTVVRLGRGAVETTLRQRRALFPKAVLCMATRVRQETGPVTPTVISRAAARADRDRARTATLALHVPLPEIR